jgi:hypothetical protein
MPPRRAQEPRQRRAAGQRGVLSRVSDIKRDWRALYVPWLVFLIALNPYCRRCEFLQQHGNRNGRNLATEGHHPFGQQGALILAVLPFCRSCHTEVENNKKQARKDGWIRYQ